jgi:alpha-N-acetylglucosaminidase
MAALRDHHAATEDSPARAAESVMRRNFPLVVGRFHFKTVPLGKELSYRYRAAKGEVYVEGPNAVAMSRGAYDYLRTTLGAQVSWSGSSLPDGKLTDTPWKRVDSPYQFVLQDNVCTFGYTTAYYGWKQWEHYLDVMALHGVNMEFAPVGSEAIWAETWKKFGLTQKDLDSFFTGPAFLPWHRMGNVNGHGGPIPASYLKQSVSLQKQILGRMRSLGIKPIAPAFAGFVPNGFKAKYPAENVLTVASWAGFAPEFGTHILHPLSPMYAKIGGEYIRAWRKEFGDADYYLADSFNELEVPVSPDRATRLAELSGFGKAVYDGIRSGDPKGTWVMQGWLFYNAAGFWDKESVAALLKPVPNDKMIILDLFAEAAPIWKMQDAFYGKPWIVSTITTWGGNNQVYGNFEKYRQLSAETLAAPNHGNLVGFGLSFEGSESNEAEYELLCDSAWSADPIKLEEYLPKFVRNRYGNVNPHAVAAWTKFAASVYNMGFGVHPNHLMQSRPHDLSPTSRGEVHDSALFREGVKELLAARTDTEGQLYTADVMQFTAQLALLEADHALRDAVLTASDGDTAASKSHEAKFVALVNQADQLLANHPLDRVSRWEKFAELWGSDAKGKAYYRSDARRQVTTWGGPVLTEYAAKMWAGLLTQYYAPRWTQWLEAKRSGKPFDVLKWEEQWIRTGPVTPVIRPSKPDVAVEKAAKVLAALPPFGSPTYASTLQGQVLGRWASGEPNTQYASRTWSIEVSAADINATGTLTIRFQYESGSHRLHIEAVEILENGKVVATDPHEGRTGLEDVANTYRFPNFRFEAGRTYELRARVRSDGGRDSNGTIYLRFKPKGR